MNKKLQIWVIPALSLLLTACTPVSKYDSNHPIQKNQICQEIRQKMLMNNLHNVPDEQGYSPTEMASLYKKYQKYDCAHKLGET